VGRRERDLKSFLVGLMHEGMYNPSSLLLSRRLLEDTKADDPDFTNINDVIRS
jgi:hypothetical protein